MLAWLLGAALGPAAVALPVNWAADALAGAAQRWFKRVLRKDDLSRLVKAATGTSVELTNAEFDAVRGLLEDRQTWTVLSHGTVEDLAARIAACLPPREGRTHEDAQVAAISIARGLLEFAVADLDPPVFQKVLMARLQRMETGQATALDAAMVDLHADLAVGFGSVLEQLKRVLERLPPGPVQRGEIAVYLKTLIEWLNTDPWPRDRRFNGPALTPAVIERKLRATTNGIAMGDDLDADELTRRCRRLVMLGGPGSGKTWLAKRTARRCAEDALRALAAGGTLDEIELPLYTTCSRLFRAGGDIREAVVSSALDQLGDLGGSRLNTALRMYFSERGTPTLLVIDSLDEAQGSDERLRQADTLPWRIVLTSRPSSWNQQLAIKEGDNSRRVGELQPLRYPDDVEPFIRLWFAERPEWGDDLAAQIAQRPGLQQAATVPLILAFYCIVGGSDPLPDFRRELYVRVLNRMLTSRWRSSDDTQPDVDACIQTLRAWAWSGARCHPVSGLATWTDDILAEPSRLSRADQNALDNVATPLGPADVDTRKTLRRFVHRSIREHLVAEYVASLPLEEAAEALLPHIWYDPDWESALPAAVVMHPGHDQLLRDLLCRAARSDQIPGDLSVIDVGWECRALLARVAAESNVADWSPALAGMIGTGRIELARAGRILDGAASWGTSNGLARQALLDILARETDGYAAGWLALGVARLDPTEKDKRQARDALLALLPSLTNGYMAGRLARVVVQLDPAEEDKRQARDALLTLLPGQTDHLQAADMIGGLVLLLPTAEDKRQARDALLALLADPVIGRAAWGLAGGLVRLVSTAEDKRQVREALLALLAGPVNGPVAWALADGVVRLVSTAEDKRQVREALLALLAGPADGWVAAGMASGVAELDPTAEDKEQVREALLGLLAGQADSTVAARLTNSVIQLDPAAEDKHRACEALLRLLADETDGEKAADLAGRVAGLDLEGEDKHRALRAVLSRLQSGQSDEPWSVGMIAELLARLVTSADDTRQACDAVLSLLAGQADGWAASELAGGLAQLDPTAEDRRQAVRILLRLLTGQTSSLSLNLLFSGLAKLDPAAEDYRQACDTVLSLLTGQPGSDMATTLAWGVRALHGGSEEKRQARTALHRLLAEETDRRAAAQLVGEMTELDPTLRELDAWTAWAAPPTIALVAAVRRSTALADWLAALPWLPSISSSPR